MARTYKTGGAGTNGIVNAGTINTLPKYTAATTLGNSSITDNGTTISLGGKQNVTEATGITALDANITTAALGHPITVAEADLFGQTANVASITSFTPAVEGTFIIDVAVNVTVIVVGAVIEVTYTDHNAAAQTDPIPLALVTTGTTTAGAFTTASRWSGRHMIRATSATAIVVKTISYVSGTYDVSVHQSIVKGS